MPYKDKDKQREYNRLWLQKRRQSWIDSQGGVCSNCGRSDLPFEVDHIDPSTKIDHKVWSWAQERREAELAKCQLLCQECHWQKTGGENSGWAHGESGYHHKCRCETCVQEHSRLKHEYRRRRREAGLPYK